MYEVASTGPVRAVTLQVSSGGFAALLAKGSQVGEGVKVTLGVPGGEPLQDSARVVSVKEHLGDANTSVQFVSIGASEAERMESLAFDALLDQLKDW
jgi:c-di-GMP-binding flagellar brake protein YcgR